MRFGRKRNDGSGESSDQAGHRIPAVPGTDDGRTAPAPTSGPFDDADVEIEDADLIDLGSLLLPTPDDDALPVELRLQVDESSETVLSALLVGEEGAIELRVFAASRGADLWSQARRSIAAQAAADGGTTDEREGAFGTELLCVTPVQDPEGNTYSQPSRVIGVNGPRWLLRATMLGRPAAEPDSAGDWDDLLRAVIVRRGQEPMSPGQALPLRLPPQARKVG